MDNEINVRKAVAEALGKIRDKRAVEPLIKAYIKSSKIDNRSTHVVQAPEYMGSYIEEHPGSIVEQHLMWEIKRALAKIGKPALMKVINKIGRASCRERV